MGHTHRRLVVILLLASVVCGAMAVKSWTDEKNAGREYETLREDAISKEMETLSETEDELTAEKMPEPVEIPVDFLSLQEQNPDVYAWIQIPGTKIDYPVVQREDNNGYYLNHTVEGEKKREGAIFTEDDNWKDFTDPNTVIYGHNMKNGSMFRGLHDYRDRKFFREHQKLLIYQPDRILHYQIFAAYVYDNRHLLKSFSFEDEEVFERYLQSIFERKDMGMIVDDEVEITADDKIITLSTCNGNDEQRYLVQAVLLYIEKGK